MQRDDFKTAAVWLTLRNIRERYEPGNEERSLNKRERIYIARGSLSGLFYRCWEILQRLRNSQLV